MKTLIAPVLSAGCAASQAQGHPPTEFGLLRQAENEAVFENAAHDFPQRVLYRREAADRLVARIEGLRNGQLRGIDFAMQRTASL